ncbi:MAG TPA: hypothetical protein VIW92_00310, partial [Thermoanaerobaculia bacterium]
IILRSPNYFGVFLEEGDLTYRQAEAKWVYDTSDDPLFPTRGASVSAGLEASRFETRNLSERRFFFMDGTYVVNDFPDYEAEQVVAAFSGVRHWSVTPRQTVSATVRLAVGQSQIENLLVGDRPVTGVDYYGGSISVQHATTLLRSREVRDAKDLRLETGAELGAERVNPGVAPSNPLERLRIWTGLTFRHPWGRIRLILSYLDVGEVFR